MTRCLTILISTALAGACAKPKPTPGGGRGATRVGGGAAETVRFTSTDGRFVGLGDGSLWNIDWPDAATTAAWSPGQRVRVRRTATGSFPYRLIDGQGRQAAARHGKRLD